MTFVALVLASALLQASWNAILRREPDKSASCLGIMLVTLAATGLLAAVALAGGASLPTGKPLVATACAGLCEAGYIATLFLALERAPLGVSYTVSRGGAILIAWPLSALLLDERASALAIGGTALVLCGLLAVGFERGASRSALAWSALCAVFVAGYHLFYKRAVAGEAAAVVVSLSLSIAVTLNLVLARSKRAVADALRTRARILVPAGVASAASFLLVLVALRMGGAARVLTLRHASVVFAALIGWALGERPTARQLAGASLVALGATLLALG